MFRDWGDCSVVKSACCCKHEDQVQIPSAYEKSTTKEGDWPSVHITPVLSSGDRQIPGPY